MAGSSSLYQEPAVLTLHLLACGRTGGLGDQPVRLRFRTDRPVAGGSGSGPREVVPRPPACQDWVLRCPPPTPPPEKDPLMRQLLECCTQALGLPNRACQLYSSRGKSLTEVHRLKQGQLVYVSQGGPFVVPHSSANDRRRREALQEARAALNRMDHLQWLYQLTRSGRSLGVDTLQPGEIVALATQSAPKKANVLSCIMSDVAAMVTESNIKEPVRETHEYHFKSHSRSEKLRLSRQPSWQRVEAPASEQEGRGTGHAHSMLPRKPQGDWWVWHGGHLVLTESRLLALTAEQASAGSAVVVWPIGGRDQEQLWELTHEGYLCLSQKTDLVLTVVGLSTRQPKVRLMPRGEPRIRTSPLSQQWAGLVGTDRSRFRLQPFSGTQEEEVSFYSTMGEVCCQALVGGEPRRQLGYRLMPAAAQAPPLLLCRGCGHFLRKQQPCLLLEELAAEQSFSCACGSQPGGRLGGLRGPLGPFTGKVDLSRYQLHSTLRALRKVDWAALPSAEAIEKEAGRGAGPRTTVHIHQCGTLEGGVAVGVSSLDGILAAAEDIFSQPAESIFLRDGSLVTSFDDICPSPSTLSPSPSTLSPSPPTRSREELVHVWVCGREDVVSAPSAGNNATHGLTVHESSCQWLREPATVRAVSHPSASLTPNSSAAARKKTSVLLNYRKPVPVLVYRCGSARSSGQAVLARTLEQLLSDSSSKLGLTSAARAVFTEQGRQIQSIDELSRGQCLAVSTSRSFSSELDTKVDIARKAAWARKHGVSQRN